MTKIEELAVYTTEIHGRWFAATNRAPFFCFEAKSEKEALAVAGSALKFYVGEKGQILSTDVPNFERFQPKNRIPASELAAA